MLKESPTFSRIRTPSSYPASHKRYFPGDHADMGVPHREVTLSATHHTDRTEENPPLPVYDTSGPYTDADVRIDLSRGLPDVRSEWIKQRGDTEVLSGPTSEYVRRRERVLLSQRYALRTRRDPSWAWAVILFAWIGIPFVLAILFSVKAFVATVQLYKALAGR